MINYLFSEYRICWIYLLFACIDVTIGQYAESIVWIISSIGYAIMIDKEMFCKWKRK
jgi:hypothetical protein